MDRILKLALVLVFLMAFPALAVQQIESREGYFVLEFNQLAQDYDGLEVVELKGQAQVADFENAQRFDISGQQQATLSGFADGHYQARVTDSSGAKSPKLIAEIDVRHRSLTQALTLFAVGLGAFLLLAGLLFSFNRKEANDA
ncbi:hypothetical protein [Lacimicrobium sp. SS2-24]|uniref:hypothetical protein n=1 Tax=Lacimicrobium sp. SS2-24 TaxID=2005569 RepID=UPI000B4A7403|nr:hypothetical protein [Lacimicrobium sp. SS2-24]